jgi:uncharacterized lipoprotein YmbA
VAHDVLDSPIAQAMVNALSTLQSSRCFAKNHRPEEQAKQTEARVQLAELRSEYPSTWTAVRRRLSL